MKVTINTIEIARHTGYGRAAHELIEALRRAGVQVVDDAPTIVNFCMPKDYVYRDYTVGYTPWESTEVPPSWKEKLLRVDDLWSTSFWSSKIFRDLTGRSVWTLHHGLNDTWTPTLHSAGKEFKFIHVGEPALRKGGDIVLQAWYKAFRRVPNVHLQYKCVGIPMARVKDRSGSIIYSPGHLIGENGSILNCVLTDNEMASYYQFNAHCLLYPTRGEGFGFIPLEAMACGLPTILPNDGGTADFAWAGVKLRRHMWRCSDELEHPGLWMDHDVDELIMLMRHVYENYNDHAERAYENAFLLKEQFSWDSAAQNFIQRLADKL